MKITWSHKQIAITDIRKVKQFYIIAIDDEEIKTPLFVDHGIFEARLKSYFLSESRDFTRKEIMYDCKWNMLINKGFYHKLDKENNIEKIEKNPDKYYLSFLEIDGILGKRLPG